MAGSALRDHRRKAAFIARLMAVGRALDDQAIAALAEEMAQGICQVWLWDDRLETFEPAAEGAAAAAKTEVTSHVQPEPVADATADEASAFDPFAFSVIVVLKRQGRARLLQQLETISNPAHLRQIAEAQHIGIDASIRSLKLLREAIVDGAEQRLADRRAAAS